MSLDKTWVVKFCCIALSNYVLVVPAFFSQESPILLGYRDSSVHIKLMSRVSNNCSLCILGVDIHTTVLTGLWFDSDRDTGIFRCLYEIGSKASSPMSLSLSWNINNSTEVWRLYYQGDHLSRDSGILFLLSQIFNAVNFSMAARHFKIHH